MMLSSVHRVADARVGRRTSAGVAARADVPIEVRRERSIAIEASPARRLLTADLDGGRPLPTCLRDAWSTRLGRPLDDIRVHDDPATGQAVRSTGANAVSYGNDLYFAPGAYDPVTASGRTLLGHELAHALQTCPAGRSAAPGHDHSAWLERQADRVGGELASRAGPVAGVPVAASEPAVRGDKSISFSGDNVTVTDTYVLRGPGVSDEVLERFRAALDEYYNAPSFEYRGYHVTFRLTARRERATGRGVGPVAWESTDWSSDSDTSMITVESGTGRAGGYFELSIYDTSTKGTIAHEVGHYLSDRVGYFSEGYTEGPLSRLGFTDTETEIRPEAIADDGTVDIMARSQTGSVTEFSLSGILDEAIDEHEEELEEQRRAARFEREMRGVRRAFEGDPASVRWFLRGLGGG